MAGQFDGPARPGASLTGAARGHRVSGAWRSFRPALLGGIELVELPAHPRPALVASHPSTGAARGQAQAGRPPRHDTLAS